MACCTNEFDYASDYEDRSLSLASWDALNQTRGYGRLQTGLDLSLAPAEGDWAGYKTGSGSWMARSFSANGSAGTGCSPGTLYLHSSNRDDFPLTPISAFASPAGSILHACTNSCHLPTKPSSYHFLAQFDDHLFVGGRPYTIPVDPETAELDEYDRMIDSSSIFLRGAIHDNSRVPTSLHAKQSVSPNLFPGFALTAESSESDLLSKRSYDLMAELEDPLGAGILEEAVSPFASPLEIASESFLTSQCDELLSTTHDEMLSSPEGTPAETCLQSSLFSSIFPQSPEALPLDGRAPEAPSSPEDQGSTTRRWSRAKKSNVSKSFPEQFSKGARRSSRRRVQKQRTVEETAEVETATAKVRGSKGSSSIAKISRTTYKRPRRARVKCHQCNKNATGFRGEHELRRHEEREHAPTRKVWITQDQSEDGKFLANCKACSMKKRYGIYYNALAHLRRSHFNTRSTNERRGGKGGGSEPSATWLMDRGWIKELEEPNPHHKGVILTKSAQRKADICLTPPTSPDDDDSFVQDMEQDSHSPNTCEGLFESPMSTNNDAGSPDHVELDLLDI